MSRSWLRLPGVAASTDTNFATFTPGTSERPRALPNVNIPLKHSKTFIKIIVDCLAPMWFNSLDLLIAVFLAGIIHQRFNGKGYYFSWADSRTAGQEVDWLSGRNFCRQRCMDLVSLETSAENEFIKSRIVQSTVTLQTDPVFRGQSK